MPIHESLFAAGFPPAYRNFLNDLWDAQQLECNGFSNVPVRTKNGKLTPTPLKMRREALESLASCDAVRCVAKKAMKTSVGMEVLQSITIQAMHLPEMVDSLPCDFGAVRKRKIEALSEAMEKLIDIIQYDKVLDSIVITADRFAGISLEGEVISATSTGDINYGWAFCDIVSGAFPLGQLVNPGEQLEKANLKNMSGRLTVYGIQSVLESFRVPVSDALAGIDVGCDVTNSGDERFRRYVYMLWDCLDEYLLDFTSGQLKPLRPAALVAAMITGLENPYSDSKTTQIRVHEVLKRRQKS